MKKEEITKEVFGLIEDVLDTLIEVGNGTTDEMLHEAANKLFRVRDLLKAKIMAIKALEQQSEDAINKDLVEYEKDLNELKEQILKEGNTLLTKRDLLERFCKIDEEYNDRSWNLLQILANINILIGQGSCEDAISRQAAISLASGACHPANVAKELMRLPSVQPKYNTSEWCHDCSEYDQDKHCCPRFNKVIRNTVKEMKEPKTEHWIPVSEGIPNEYADVICCTDAKEVFIATYLGKMNDGTDCFDDANGMMCEGDVIAWMPLPKP